MTINLNAQTRCEKHQMADDGIIRYSVIDIIPEHLKEYLPLALEVGEVSMKTEPGVLAMYPTVADDDSCRVTILEIYSSRDAYKSHIASRHFQKYKQSTLHMVKSLQLLDQKPMNPKMTITSDITERP
ncbi:putative quinol monooxygenase [uncultured Muribaculum sp.]|nr:antibiotic biosynthesis monooxygenase family protein [uncultured Muribaculum sp.]